MEIAKQQLAEGGARVAETADTLVRVFDMTLRLLHPFTPFVTEELWGHLRRTILQSPISGLAKDWPEALIVARWPKPRKSEGWEEFKITDFALIQEIVRSIRNLRGREERRSKQTDIRDICGRQQRLNYLRNNRRSLLH